MLREKIPARSAPAAATDYRAYKGQLRADFGASCGYCDAPDYIFGGIRAYQIDHFAPQKRFPHLRLAYGNLVYACAFCNRAKWDKWIGHAENVPNDGKSGFVDPCSGEYDQQLDRSDEGKFQSLSRVGEYMVSELKLGLSRHQIVWQSQAIKRLRDRLRSLLDNPLLTDKRKLELLTEIDELTQSYERFRSSAIEP